MSREITKFKNLLPELGEQEEVAAAAHNLEGKKDLYEKKRTQLQDLFRTLFNELMTAKIRVSKTSIPTTN